MDSYQTHTIWYPHNDTSQTTVSFSPISILIEMTMAHELVQPDKLKRDDSQLGSTCQVLIAANILYI